jgi:hypothetical protein
MTIEKLEKGDEIDTIPIEDGICRIYPGEFGWGPDTFRDAPTKASYCYTYVLNYHPEHLNMLKDALTRYIKCKEIRFERGEGDLSSTGYIDHQSDNVCEEAFESLHALCNFIFNPKSVLVIDNDNH